VVSGLTQKFHLDRCPRVYETRLTVHLAPELFFGAGHDPVAKALETVNVAALFADISNDCETCMDNCVDGHRVVLFEEKANAGISWRRAASILLSFIASVSPSRQHRIL